MASKHGPAGSRRPVRAGVWPTRATSDAARFAGSTATGQNPAADARSGLTGGVSGRFDAARSARPATACAAPRPVFP